MHPFFNSIFRLHMINKILAVDDNCIVSARMNPTIHSDYVNSSEMKHTGDMLYPI